MKSIHFKQAIMLASTVFIALAFIIFNVLSYSALKSSTETHVHQQLSSVSRYEAQQFKLWFTQQVNIVKNLAEHTQKNTFDDYVMQAKVNKSLGDLGNIIFGFEDGRAYSASNRGYWRQGVADLNQYDPRKQAWFALGSANAGLQMTPLYRSKLRKNLVTGVSHRIDGGVLVATVNLDYVEELIRGINLYQGSATIVDQQGQVIASNNDQIETDSQLADVGLSPVLQAIQASRSSASSVNYQRDGEKKLAVIEPITLLNGTTWYLILEVAHSHVYAEVAQHLWQSILICFVMMFLTIGATLLVLNYVYRPVHSLKVMVQHLSQGNGDLTQRLAVTSKDDLGEIAHGINLFIGQLQTLLLEIAQASSHIQASVGQLQTQANHNNQMLTAHSQETEQIVIAVEEMSATAGEVARHATNASQLTSQATNQTEQSKQVVLDTTQTINTLVHEVQTTSQSITRIGADTENITSVLKVIGDIADQTNLLALNAAIEAARAGDQGRGFAVVADEVRALAARTQVSTAEIEQTLSKLVGGANNAIHSMQNTQQSCQRTAVHAGSVADNLNEINRSVTDIYDLNQQITTAAREQSSVTDEIAQNMSSIRDIVLKLSHSGMQVSAEANNLAAANEQLKSVVNQFRLQ